MGVAAASATHAAKVARSGHAAPAAAFLARPTSPLLHKTCDCGATAGLSGHCLSCDRASLSSRPGPGTAADVASFAPGHAGPELGQDLGRLGVSSAASPAAIRPTPPVMAKPMVPEAVKAVTVKPPKLPLAPLTAKPARSEPAPAMTPRVLAAPMIARPVNLGAVPAMTGKAQAVAAAPASLTLASSLAAPIVVKPARGEAASAAVREAKPDAGERAAPALGLARRDQAGGSRQAAPTSDRGPRPRTAPIPLVRQTSPVRVQTQLHVSSSGDAAEREAHAVGHMVARMPAPEEGRKGVAHREAPAVSDRSGQAATVHRRENGGPVDPDILASLNGSTSGGSALPRGLLSFMEPRFRADFSGVRVHTDAHAAALSARLGARAFTLGKDIYFARGEFRPDTPDGWELIAHELTHTIQQGGAARMPPIAPPPRAGPPRAPATGATRAAGGAAAPGANPVGGDAPAPATPMPAVPRPTVVVSPAATGRSMTAAGAEVAAGTAPAGGPAAARDRRGVLPVPRAAQEKAAEATSARPTASASPARAAAPGAVVLPAPASSAAPVAARRATVACASASAVAPPAAQPLAAQAPVPGLAATGGEATLAAVVSRAAGPGPAVTPGRARPTPAPAHAAEPVHNLSPTHAPAPSAAPIPAHAAERGRNPPPPHAAAVRPGRPFTVAERAPVSLQRFGVDDALKFFADKADLIPGFSMLTIVLGVNPINMAPVDRSPANILRALIRFIPGGELIVQALNNSGVFEKVGAWVKEQVETLAMSGAALKKAALDFLGTLSWRDVLNLDGVWERAKRIFTEPIDRLIEFAKGLAGAILKFIKDAILLPLAKLAQGTRGWDLLVGVLGRDPITGDTVQRTPELMIGGFLKLIGQEEVWENMKKAKAIERAWTWFQGTLATLMAFVSKIPDLFSAAFKSLTIEDVVLVSGAFQKVASVFGDFLGKFIDWAGTAIWNLLEIIFDVVSPGALTYVKKTGKALQGILKDPLPFVHNLIAAAKLGLSNFADNFGTHLKEALIDWLVGALPGVYIPKAFTLLEFGKFALSVLGITWAQIRAKIVKALGANGETIMKGLELTFDVIKALVTGGVAAAWELIKEKLTNLKDMVIDGIVGFITDAITKKAIPKLIAMFVPGAGFISAIISIYDTIKVFIEKLAKLAAVVKSFVDSIVAIAAGEISGAAKRVEGALSGVLSLAISFLAGAFGLGDIAADVLKVVKKVQETVDKALDTAIAWIVDKAKALFGAIKGGVQKLVNWWKLSTSIDSAGKKLMLSTEGEEDAPKVMVASSPGRPWSEYLKGIPRTTQNAAAYDKAVGLAQKLEAPRARITTTDETARAAAIAKAAEEMRLNFNALADQIKILNQTAGAPASVINYGPTDAVGGGTLADASILSKDHPVGTGPGDDAPIWSDLANLGKGVPKSVRANWYVQGHLLNEQLGGPGKRFNLTPLTKRANNEHKQFVETDVKTWVNTNNLVVRYVVKVKPAWGASASIPRLTDLQKKPVLTADDQAEVSSLNALRNLTTGFDCEAQELESTGADQWTPKSGGKSKSRPIPNEIAEGGKTYGYQ